MPFAQNTRCLWHRFGSRWLGIDLLAAVSKIFQRVVSDISSTVVSNNLHGGIIAYFN